MPPTAPPPPPNISRPVCAACRRPNSGRFEVNQYDAAGARIGTFWTCSVLCLIRAAYDYGTKQTVRGLGQAKNFFDTFWTHVKGGR